MSQARRSEPPDSRVATLDELHERTNLTHNQVGFWLGQRIAPASTLLNMGQVSTLHCEIDPACFQAAFQALIDRSDALRTRFHEEEGVPRQSVAASLAHQVPVLDFSGSADAGRQLKDWCAARIAEPMDVTERCFDTALIRLGKKRWAWYLCIHHLIIDGTSMDLIFRCVDGLYALARQGRLDGAAAPPQYAPYLEKERRYRESAACRRDAEFWEPRLAEPCEPAEYYGHRRTKNRNRCVRTHIDLGGPRTGELIAVTRRICGANVSSELDVLVAYLALLAAWQTRVGGQRRLIAGVPFHNRATRDEKEVVGLMMEVAPLTLDADDADSFTDLLRRARAELFTVLRHYRYGCVNAPRRKTYDVMLNLLPPSTVEFAGARADTDWLHSSEWNEALTLQVQRRRGSADEESGHRLYFDFNEELFPGGLVQRAPEHFRNLLDDVLRDPDRPIGETGILTGEERELLQRAHSNPGRTVAPDETVVSHFEAAVARTPDAVAVIEGERKIDYRTLNETANRIAAHLKARGVHRGDCIGICMRRSIERVAALAGILKAGGAYVPIDETYPAERIGQMLADASVKVIVTEAGKAGALPRPPGVELIPLDESEAELRRQPCGNPGVELAASDPAQVYFTSGSTGRPKGVIIPHRGVIRMTVDADYIVLDSNIVMLHSSSLSFDISTLEIWGSLLFGARLVLPAEPMPSAADIRRQVEKEGVNTLVTSTALFNIFIDEDPGALAGITQIDVGGEAGSAHHFAKGKAALPGARIVNGYGPTECSVTATWFAIPDGLPQDEPVPIGVPIGNTRVFVLDDCRRLVPPGGVGELYLGGSGLALGYAGQPELTRERFVALPPAGDPDAKFYRTGDMVRVRDDGTLAFLGRRDNQVKVRGVRIELDEVELALNALDEIRQAVVSLHESRADGKGLAAYVVPARPGLEAAEIRSALARRLPDNMMPRWFVLLDALPLTPTGKVDRKLLPHPAEPARIEREGTPPRDELEQRLAGLWTDVLHLSRVDVHANFFDLGGDSIRAIQLAARAAAQGLAIEAAHVFEHQTLAELANALRDGAAAEAAQTADEGLHDPAQIDQAELAAIMAELGR